MQNCHCKKLKKSLKAAEQATADEVQRVANLAKENLEINKYHQSLKNLYIKSQESLAGAKLALAQSEKDHHKARYTLQIMVMNSMSQIKRAKAIDDSQSDDKLERAEAYHALHSNQLRAAFDMANERAGQAEARAEHAESELEKLRNMIISVANEKRH